MATRPDIPSEIRRQLRKEALFGCCKCGNPILEYHHIKPYHIVKCHNPADMMAICPNCHHSIDSYTEAQQRSFKENPYNETKDNPKGQLVVPQNICAVTTGTLFLLGDGPIIKSENETYLEIFVSKQGLLEISLKLFDRANNLILEIERNDWKKGNTSVWDIEFKHKSKLLEVKEKKGVINLKVDAHKLPVEIQGKFWLGKNFVSLSNQGISIDNLKIIKPAIKSDYIKLHYAADSTPLHFKREHNDGKTTFAGPSIFSGMYINLDPIDRGLTLQPKPQPFFFESERDINSEEAIRLLEQQIETLRFFYTDATYFWPDVKKAWEKPIHGYTLLCKQESCLIFFIERLAVYLFSIGRYEESLERYKQLEAICTDCLIYDPDTMLGEVKFAISKVLEAQNRKDEAAEYYEESVNFYLKKSGQIPYRILEFSKYLFSMSCPCFCRSGTKYEECHSKQASLTEYEGFSNTEINLSGIKDDAKVTIFLGSKESCLRRDKMYTYEEYLDDYSLIFLDFYKSVTDLMFSKILGLNEDTSKKIYKILFDLGVVDGENHLSNLCKVENNFTGIVKSLEKNLSDLSQEMIQTILWFLESKAIQNFKDIWRFPIRIKGDTPILIVVKKPHEPHWVLETTLTREGIFVDMSSIKRGRTF